VQDAAFLDVGGRADHIGSFISAQCGVEQTMRIRQVIAPSHGRLSAPIAQIQVCWSKLQAHTKVMGAILKFGIQGRTEFTEPLLASCAGVLAPGWSVSALRLF